MVRTCVVCGVKKNRDAADKGIRFFRFPKPKSQAQSEWIEAIKQFRKGQFVPHKQSIVCSRHFEDRCFNRAEKRLRLVERARPTIFDVPIDPDTPMADSVSSFNDAPQPGSSRASSLVFEEEDPSDSLSPPDLLPLHEPNSDFEENVEDPPDLDLYSLDQDEYEHSDLNNLSEMGMIKMDHIGSVGDIYGPDSYLPDGGVVPPTEDRSESALTGEERDEVDGQTILSFATAEELQEYMTRQNAPIKPESAKKKVPKKCRGRRQDSTGTPTPSASPSPSLLQSVMGIGISHDDQEEDEEHCLPNQSETPSPTSTSSPSPPPSQQQAGVEEESDLNSDPVAESAPSFESTTPLPSPPPLGKNGVISAALAEYAVLAFHQPLSQRLRTSQPPTRGIIKRRKPKSALWSRQHYTSQGQQSQMKQKLEPVRVSQALSKLAVHIQEDEVPNVEIDEVLDINMMNADDGTEEVVVMEEEYKDNYDVPGVVLPEASCGKLFCRLGCICSSLEASESKNRARKGSQEHCNVPECMMQCVCGYQRGRPSRRRPFISLLKGNEAFYSKINWSGERQRRERKVPERFANYQLTGVDSPDTEYKLPASTRGGSSAGHRGGHHPFRSPPTGRGGFSGKRSDSLPKNNTLLQGQKSPLEPGSKNGLEPFRLKVCADQIKLLRWNSFVSLNKVYVAPDQEIMCMDHNKYNCPCIVKNRRIIRITSRYIPPPPPITIRSSQQNEGGRSSSVTPTKANSPAYLSSPPNSDGKRNQVAKKHTNPNMRMAHQRGDKLDSPPRPDENAQPAAQPRQAVPLNAMSKMRRLLSDERFQLQNLMMQEKARAFDEDIDLTVRQGQTVQLIAWIRFHRIYQAGQMHIRFLSRRAGPVILVMRPSEIVAADITCDIQDMQGKGNAPEIVKELLDPFVAPEETSRYAFLLCDGVKWELVGCLAHRSPSDAPSKPRETITIHPPASASEEKISASRSGAEMSIRPVADALALKERREMALRRESEKNEFSSCHPSLAESNILQSAQVNDRYNRMELKRIELEERLSQINSKLVSSRAAPPLKLGAYKPAKLGARSRSTTAGPVNQGLQPPTLSLPLSGRSSTDSGPSLPDNCILPDNSSDGVQEEEQQVNGLHHVQSLPDLVASRYPASNALAILSQLGRDDDRVAAGTVKPKTDKPIPDLAKMSIPFQMSEQLVNKADQPKSGTKHIGPLPELAKMIAGRSQPKIIRMQGPPPSNLAFLNEHKSVSIDYTTQPQVIRQPTLLKLLPLPANQHHVIPAGSRVIHIHSRSVLSPPPSNDDSTIQVAQETSGAPVAARTNRSQHASSLDSEVDKQQQSSKISPMKDSTSIAVSTIISPEKSAALTPDWSVDSDMQGLSTSLLPSPSTDSKPSIPHKTTESPLQVQVYIYPKISSAEVNKVKTPVGASNTDLPFRKRLRVAFEALTGEQRMFCPDPTSMLLPLNRSDDRWLIVAVSHVPENGLRIPGLSVSVPREVVERAAVTAGERKARVSFPIHVHSNSKNTILKKGFGVYGTPQLPCHVFLGPFPAGYLDRYTPLLPCMRQIELTVPAPPEDDEPTQQPNPVESKEEPAIQQPNPVEFNKESVTLPSTPVDESNTTLQGNLESMMQSPTKPLENPADIVDAPLQATNEEPVASDLPEVSPIQPPTETEVPVPSMSATPSLPDETAENEKPIEENGKRKRKSSGSSDDLEIIDEIKTKEPTAAKRPHLTLPALPPNSAITSSTKPNRVFVARTQGLPTTTIAIYEGGIVLVKNPLKPEKSETFSDIDSAKQWLQTLTIRNRSGEFSKDPRTDSPGNGNEYYQEMEEEESKPIFYGNDSDYFEDYYAAKEEDSQPAVESADSSPGPSPLKRARKLTEKAKALAAHAGRGSWTSAAAGADLLKDYTRSPQHDRSSFSPKSSAAMVAHMDTISQNKRNVIQRQLHIKKEQERRGLLAELLRNLDALIAPNSGTRAKIIVLKNATSTIKALEHESLVLEDVYSQLKKRRRELLMRRQKMFAGLKGNVRNVFNSLMDSTPLPVRHAELSDHIRMPSRNESKDKRLTEIIDSVQAVNSSFIQGSRNTSVMSATTYSEDDSDVEVDVVTTADVEITYFPT